MRKLAVIVTLCLLTGMGYGATIRVPQDQPTIQAGIDAASPGDTVKVAAGIYPENIILKSGIQLIGAGYDKTRITASEGGVITLDNVAEVTIEGFTIDGQDRSRYGIYCAETGSQIQIRGNRIQNIWGDGIFCYYSSPVISDNIITEITFDGIYLNWSGPIIANNIIALVGINGIHSEVGTKNPPQIYENTIQNTGSNGIFCHNNSSPLIENNIITNAGKHGIECHNESSPVIRGNQIRFSAGDGVNCNSNSRPKLRGNRIYKNQKNGVFSDELSLPNLGTDLNPGLNQIYDNALFLVYNENSLEIQAEGNWWGQDPPDKNGFQGNVDYEPWLNAPPSDVPGIQPMTFPIPRWDVNEDGIVDILDLVIVASHFGERTIPAAAAAMGISLSNRDQLLNLLTKVEQLERPLEEKRILLDFLHSLLSSHPAVTETKVFANYPNPFNPETWIPYQLAAETEVEISIYSIDGRRIRTLRLGSQSSGQYIIKGRAAYWDGRSDTGEHVPSGVYLYHFQAGGYSATGKMLLLK